MSTFHIKLIAVLTMVIDHLGLYFFPDVAVFRIVGRLSFPLFAWLIANGAYHTKNIQLYTVRLFIFALISQLPYYLVNSLVFPDFSGLNIFFTLGIGLLAIQLIKRTEKKIIWFLISLVAALTGYLLGTDYDAAGVLSVIFFYVYFNNVKKMVISQLLLFVSFYTVPVLHQVLGSTNPESGVNLIAFMQPVAVLSLVFISLYSGKEGMKAKYIFYVFYPLHLLIFYVAKTVWGL